MTVLVVSLFLPYTINFHRPAPERPFNPARRQSRNELQNATGNPPSLLTPLSDASVGLPPLTPGATTDHERIFLQTGLSAAQTQFPFPTSPIVLGPSDSHFPAWGTGHRFNQPISRTGSPPPSSILQEAKAREKFAARLRAEASNSKAVHHGNGTSNRHGFAESDWSVEPADQGNNGLHNAVRTAAKAGYLGDKLWVGTLGMPTDVLKEHRKSEIAKKLEGEHESLTVFVNDSDFDGHYSHYSKTILWPVLHYQIPDNPKSKAYEDHSWEFYVKINQAFADRIAKTWKQGDMIWIHDYHLLLLPAMLRKLLPDAQIGFFLHVAFPSSEVFKCLAVRKELLEGILGANLVGFQIEEYCQHFLQTCRSLLRVNATTAGVQLEERFVSVGKFPVGIDADSLSEIRQSSDVKDWMATITEKYQGKRLVVARDQLDRIRGVRQKLLAYELFLNKNPQWIDKVVMIQVATSTTEQAELDATVSDIVERVNSKFATLEHQPLVFLKQDISFPQYLALLSVADALMVTSLREGMNLTSHEFVYCQDGKYSDQKHGSLILSEFTGSASIFDEHKLLVNPWDPWQCANAIKTSLEMGAEEREAQWIALYRTVLMHTATSWVKSFVESLSNA